MGAAHVLVLLLLASPARADAILGPPACPPGARGASAHEGQWCMPWPCESDAQCEGGRCAEWRVCTRETLVTPGGRWATPPPQERRTLVVGTCEPSRECTGTEEPPPSTVGTLEGEPTCSEARHCVPAGLPLFPGRPPGTGSGSAPGADERGAPSAPPPATPARNCGCRAGARGGSTTFLLAVALVVLARRRR